MGVIKKIMVSVVTYLREEPRKQFGPVLLALPTDVGSRTLKALKDRRSFCPNTLLLPAPRWERVRT